MSNFESIRVLVIANIPSPYRITLFNEIHANGNINILVLYCARTESNRNWKFLSIDHPYVFLGESRLSSYLKIKYFNKGIIKHIRKFQPHVILTGGFFPTMLIAIVYSRIVRIKHLINTDSWHINEKDYNWYHILLRRLVYKTTDAFLPVSKKGAVNLIKSYKIKKKKIFIVPYAVDEKQYKPNPNMKKIYDIIFVGQFIERKMPFFAIDVIKKLRKYNKDIKVLLIGDGPLKKEVLKRMEESDIEFCHPGYLQPHELIQYYKRSRILLFPTQKDGWGVVVNEALAVGVPCVTNSNAGCANELVINNHTGFVLDLKAEKWAQAVQTYLEKPSIQKQFYNNGLSKILDYSPCKAAEQFELAVNYCMNE